MYMQCVCDLSSRNVKMIISSFGLCMHAAGIVHSKRNFIKFQRASRKKGNLLKFQTVSNRFCTTMQHAHNILIPSTDPTVSEAILENNEVGKSTVLQLAPLQNMCMFFSLIAMHVLNSFYLQRLHLQQKMCCLSC